MANEFKVKHGLIVNGSGSTVLDIQGSQGQLFSITDSLSGSLFSVGDISGIPILEVFSDDTVKLGSFGSEAIIVSGSHATVSGSFSGSFEGDGSRLTGISITGTVSSSAQIDHDQTTNFSADEHFTQANITTVGTISTGVWQGTAIDQTYLAGQSGTNTGDESDASTTVKGIVELATTAETTTGTDTTRAVTPDGLKDGYQGSTNVTTLGTISTGTWQGSAISTTYLQNTSGTNTGDESDASTTVKGIVELATTAEVTTGTDTTRAVTPDALNDGYQGTANIDTLGTVTSGDVTAILPSGVISGSSQVNADTVTNFDTNVKAKMNSDAVVSGSATNVRSFLNVENGADVTDSSNVQAAGAVMDSEVTDLDGIKSLTVPNSTTISTFGASLVDDANAATARTTLGVDAAGTDNSTDVTLTGTPDYITISGQTITRNQINLTTDVTGDLPIAEGGTGASTAAAARTNLGVDAAGTDNSTDVTLDGSRDYITISGQTITRNQIDISDDTNLAVSDTSGQTGINLSLTGDTLSGVVSGLGTSATPTFSGLTVSNDVTINGDLTVLGDATELQVSALNIEDINITIASGAADSSAANGAGITIAGANETLTWDHGNSRFTFSDDLNVGGNITLSGTVDGVDIASRDHDAVTLANTNYLSISGQEITGNTVPIGSGGTGATTAAAARTALGVDAAGTDNSTDVTLSGTPDYITISGQVITRNAIDLANDVTGDLPVADGGTGASTAAAARTNLGVDAAGTDNSTDVTLTGTPDYITISGQTITRNQIDLTADVTGDLPVSEGGTGASSAAAARTNLGVDAAGTDNSTDVTIAAGRDYITISGQELTLGQIDISDDTNLAASTGITLTGDTLSTTDSEIVHDNLSGFVANEHIDHSGVSITAGDGLSGGGNITATRTLTLNTGSTHFSNGVSASAAAAGFGSGGGGGSTPTVSVGQYTSTDTTTDINTASYVIIPFNSTDGVTDTNNYSISAGRVTISEAGTYWVYGHISYDDNGATSPARGNVALEIFKNGTSLGYRGAMGYLRNSSGHDEASNMVAAYVSVSANDIIDIRGIGIAAIATCNLVSGESAFALNKVGGAVAASNTFADAVSDTGTALDLQYSGGSFYSMGAASSATSYTLGSTRVGGWAKVFVNASSKPSVAGSTEMDSANSGFVTSADCYLVVTYDGSNARHFFTKI